MDTVLTTFDSRERWVADRPTTSTTRFPLFCLVPLPLILLTRGIQLLLLALFPSIIRACASDELVRFFGSVGIFGGRRALFRCRRPASFSTFFGIFLRSELCTCAVFSACPCLSMLFEVRDLFPSLKFDKTLVVKVVLSSIGDDDEKGMFTPSDDNSSPFSFASVRYLSGEPSSHNVLSWSCSVRYQSGFYVDRRICEWWKLRHMQWKL